MLAPTSKQATTFSDALSMRALLCGVVLLLLAPSFVSGQEQPIRMPRDVRSVLNRSFPNWKFLKMNPEIGKFLRQEVSPETHPEFIKGDFDGNGREDYAAYVVHGSTANKKLSVVALLRKQGRLKLYILESGAIAPPSSEEQLADYYLALNKKGSKGYNFLTKKDFRFVNDAIFVGNYEKAGESYVYRKGKFRYIVTCD